MNWNSGFGNSPFFSRGWLGFWIGWLWLSGSAASVYAQNRVTPVSGVARIWGSVADNDRPTALHLNPAGLAFQPAWGIHYLHSDVGNPLDIGRGEGDALFVSFKPFAFWGLGTGIQVLYPEPVSGPNQTPLGGHVRLSLGTAFRAGTWLAVGMNFHAFLGDNRDIQSLTLFDVGLVLRPWNFLSLGVMARNLNAPAWGTSGQIIPRTWELGLSLRPLGHDRWIISSDVRLPELGPPFQFAYRMEGEPVPGWILGVRVSHDFPVQSVGIEAFLGFRFGHFGVETLAVIDTPTSSAQPTRWGGWTASLWYSASPYRSVVQPTGRMPLLDISGSLPERKHSFPFGRVQPHFLHLLLALERARKDPSVRGILLRIGSLSCGLSKIQEIRNALQRFRQSGKTIVVYLTSAQTKSYYLASMGHKIILHPAGNVWLQGLRTRHFFLAPLLQKLGIRPQFVKYGKYKTGPNQFTHSGMTPAHKEASTQLLDDLSNQWLQDLAQSRQVSPTKVQDWLKQGIYAAPQARQAGLVDETYEWDELWPKLAQHYQNQLWLDTQYFQHHRVPSRWKDISDTIAIIHIDGAIVSGTNLDDPLFGVHLSGASTIIQSLLRAQHDPRIRAVVLRIDSPGGEVLASDLVWRYVSLLRQVKPVVVSMGTVAASGGYYVAAPAHQIIASPTTVTGSIGIYAGKFDFSGLLQKIGVKIETTQRKGTVDWFDPFSSWTPEQYKQFQAHIEVGYLQFLQKVADGRKMKLETVKKIAAGRVWSGVRAKSLGLIDQWGGLWKSLQVARQLAGITPETTVRYLSLPERSFWQLSPRSALGFSTSVSQVASSSPSDLDPVQQLFLRLRSQLSVHTPFATGLAQMLSYWRVMLERLQTMQLWAILPPPTPIP